MLIKGLIELLWHFLTKIADEVIDMVFGDLRKEEMSEKESYKIYQIIVLACITLLIVFFVWLVFSLIPVPSDKSEKNPENQKSLTTPYSFNFHGDVHFNLTNITPYVDGAMIRQHQGFYYIVDLKTINNDYKKEILYFEPGKYYIADESLYFDFVRSFDFFVNEIIDPIARMGEQYKIFIRGKADKLPMRDQAYLNSIFPFKKILYVKKSQPNKYDLKNTAEHKIGNYYDNNDLPFLRAKYVQELIINDELYTLPQPIILEGEITKRVDERDRNVEIILFSEKQINIYDQKKD